MSISICPGTFDPITNGHIDIVKRAALIHEKVILAVALDSEKHLLFDIKERVEMAREAVKNNSQIVVESFDSLVVEFARQYKAKIIIRGLRAVSDFEHEFQMAQLNRKMAPDIETVFIMASTDFAYLSSSAVKEIASFGGKISSLVPKAVEIKLKSKYS